MRTMKSHVLAFALGVFLGCTQSPYTNEPEHLRLVNLDRNQVIELIEMPDPSLSLYRNEGTRAVVEKFFIRVAGSERIAKVILRYSDELDLSLFLTFSVAFVESGYNPRAVNRNSGSIDRGLFQLNSRSFPHLRESDFFNIELNTQYGLKYLRQCIEIGGNDIIALAMYNAGNNQVVSRGAPVSTLEHISKYVEYRKRLEREFRQYLRSVYSENKVAVVSRAFRP
ncbi:MAG: transglycosylase SLT domain-containing protein [Spirochaetales bacterium]